jgi:putative sigma-54 modulation protein
VRGKFNGTAGRVETAQKIVKTKRFILEPILPDEAVEQMELLGHGFYLFLDADTSEIKLLYRRHDGDYGLIEPKIG